MKPLIRNTLLALACTAVLGTASLAFADSANGPAGGGPGWHDTGRIQAMQQRRTQHLAELKDALKLRPNQEAAWQAFADAVNPSQPPLHPAFSKAGESRPMPEVLDQRVQWLEQRITRAKSVAAAGHQLYDTLTPEQRATLDKSFAQRRDGRHFKHHHYPEIPRNPG